MVTLSLGRDLGLDYYVAMQFHSSPDASDPQTAMVEECVLGLPSLVQACSSPRRLIHLKSNSSSEQHPMLTLLLAASVMTFADTETEAQRRKAACSRCLS